MKKLSDKLTETEREKQALERKNAEHETNEMEIKLQLSQLQSELQQVEAYNKLLQQQYDEQSKLLAECRAQKACIFENKFVCALF